MDITARLEALAAAPKPFVVIIVYSDGEIRRIEAGSKGAAENAAFQPTRQIGKDITRRETGETVQITSVEIKANA